MYTIIILIIGIAIGYYWGKSASAKATAKQGGLIERQAKEKEKNKKEILEYFNNHQEVKNDDIQVLLDVSDATATRYLQELEDKGVIRQVGDKGGYIYYKKV